MRLPGALLLMGLALCVVSAAYGAPNHPSVGYVYPAGGQQGATVEVLIGGQNLRGAADAYVSGRGVHASVTEYLPPPRREQLQELQRHLFGLLGQRPAPGQRLRRGQNAPQAKPPVAGAKGKKAGQAGPVTLPDHPMLRNLDQMSADELRAVADRFLKWRRVQPTPAAIAETAVVRITVDRDAPPGERELRLRTPAGLSNPLRFAVGTMPEVLEHEPNGPGAAAAAPLEVPVVLNGDIMPGDIDQFPIRARRGQQLVIAAQARRLRPYLADAVPGWFQATLALYDARGREVAFNDDYRFDPDPVIFYQVPQDGVYTVQIRDAIFRGREDFIYRISVGEQPFITAMFPLGGKVGTDTVASIVGWNLPRRQVQLDTQPGGDCIRPATWQWNRWLSNQVCYAVDTLPECNETESNNDIKQAQRVALPRIINGRIERPGDVDVFRFEGRAGDGVVAEVYARRLDSPLDSLLRLTDASGRIVAWNDDHDNKEIGLITHQADSYLSAKLPRSGTYYVEVSDAQHHGGDAYAYRLRVSPPRPDFALRVTPSGLGIPVGRAMPVTVTAFRKDGFNGDIEIVLKDAPPGFALSGGRIRGGQDSARMTLTAPGEPLDSPVALHLEGRARVGEATISRPVLPADKMMQAFAYWHLAPAQEFVVAVTGARRLAGSIALTDRTPIRIPLGGIAQVHINTPPLPMLANLRFELSEPPKGVTLQEVTTAPNGLVLTLKADANAAQVGYADNLIVEASAEVENVRQRGKAAGRKGRVSLGVLPAIPFEIVR
jgi:hypothetical protein